MKLKRKYVSLLAISLVFVAYKATTKPARPASTLKPLDEEEKEAIAAIEELGGVLSGIEGKFSGKEGHHRLHSVRQGETKDIGSILKHLKG